jgi:UDP-N-acetylenolpyruvoylglucosamine reductase
MNKSLTELNTFGIKAKAEQLIEIHSVTQLQIVLKEISDPFFVLGGGSNILLLNDLRGTVLKVCIPKIKIERDFKHSVYLSAGGGVNWHQLVLYAMENDLGGLENLSLIPGTVGASPMQNIGAYGVEIKDVFHRLEAVEIATRKLVIFRKKEMNFGYRTSVFKNKLKGKYIITKVWFKLSKPPHRLRLSYGAIKAVLQNSGITKPNIQQVSKAVIKIRSEKLPDPREIGNAGSFFKNPIIEMKVFSELRHAYPNLPHYPQPDGTVKLPAAWLIEQCGWKGKRIGNTGTHIRQALVLVNHQNATGTEIFELAQKIQESVRQKFAISLEMEVNIWD